jgi:hypothetical protein
MCGFLFPIIRLPFALIGFVASSVFWLVCLLVVALIGVILSIFVITFCALANNKRGMDNWFESWGSDWLGAILSNWGRSISACWNFFVGNY